MRSIKYLTLLLCIGGVLFANVEKSNAFLGIFIDEGYLEDGVKIADVIPHSPAEIYGLKKNQIIIKINTVTILNEKELRTELAKYRPNDKIKVHVKANQNIDAYYVKLSDRLNFEQKEKFQSKENVFLGAKIINLNPQLYSFFDVKNGIFIEEIEVASNADQAGLRAGDIIIKADNKITFDIQDLASTINTSMHKQSIPILVKRKDKMKTIEYVIPEKDTHTGFRIELDYERNAFLINPNTKNAKIIDLNQISQWFENVVNDSTKKEIKSQIHDLENELQKLKAKIQNISE